MQELLTHLGLDAKVYEWRHFLKMINSKKNRRLSRKCFWLPEKKTIFFVSPMVILHKYIF